MILGVKRTILVNGSRLTRSNRTVWSGLQNHADVSCTVLPTLEDGDKREKYGKQVNVKEEIS